VGEYFGVAATSSGFTIVLIQGAHSFTGPGAVPIIGKNSVVVAEVTLKR
jgi:hypothetical protein